jgi:hypothetical protein
MGTIATDTGGGKTYAPAPAGSHRAVCVSVIDLGLQTTNFQGRQSVKPQVLLSWEMVDELMDDGRPFTLSRTFTLSLHEKATLRAFLNNWRGQPFTEADLKGWDLKRLLGQSCMLSVVHEDKGERVYANVGAASRLPKGMTPPDKTHNELRYYSIDDHVIPAWMPWWIANKIRDSQEYKQNDFIDEAPREKGQPGQQAAAQVAPASPPATQAASQSRPASPAPIAPKSGSTFDEFVGADAVPWNSEDPAF